MTLNKTETVYAYLAEEDDGTEGIVAAFLCGAWMPLVFAKKEKAFLLAPFAQNISTDTNKKIRLCKFSGREEVKTLSPKNQ